MPEDSRADTELPVAMFDSGVGGLTVFRAISALLPQENLLYLGDTARVPYGTKSQATIVRYTLNAANALARRGIKMLVVACNTATAAALPTLREAFAPIPVIGVIEPGAAAACKASHNHVIAVIGTEATIRGNAYQKAIGRLEPGTKVIGRPCTLFVPLAEEGWLDGEVPEGVARRYLEDMFSGSEQPDTLLLGCTHFPLFTDILQKVAGEKVRIVDSASATAQKVADILRTKGLLRSSSTPGSQRFMTTDNIERFVQTGELFLGHPLDETSVELVDLQQFTPANAPA